MSKTFSKKLKVEDLNNYQVARWWALAYGVNLVADKAEERGINFEDLNINRTALEKYVDELADDILHQIETGEEYDHKTMMSIN
jgi:hypothetical protein